MKRKRKVKITVTHRRRVNLDQSVMRIHCPACGHEIKTPGPVQAEENSDAVEILSNSNLQRTAFRVPALAGSGSFTSRAVRG